MAALQRAAFKEGLLGFLPEGFALEAPEEWEGRLAEVLGSDGVEGLIAEGPDGLLGLVMFGLNRHADPAPSAGELRALFVHPSSWRSGVGRAPGGGALEGLRGMGYECVTLWSVRDNDRVTAFYESLGFRRDGATQLRESPGGAEVRYAREL